jgi:hypothetical protein
LVALFFLLNFEFNRRPSPSPTILKVIPEAFPAQARRAAARGIPRRATAY